MDLVAEWPCQRGRTQRFGSRAPWLWALLYLSPCSGSPRVGSLDTHLQVSMLTVAPESNNISEVLRLFPGVGGPEAGDGVGGKDPARNNGR